MIYLNDSLFIVDYFEDEEHYYIEMGLCKKEVLGLFHDRSLQYNIYLINVKEYAAKI